MATPTAAWMLAWATWQTCQPAATNSASIVTLALPLVSYVLPLRAILGWHDARLTGCVQTVLVFAGQ